MILFPEDTKEQRYVTRQMEKFEPVLSEKVTEPGQIAGLTGQLGVGQGAFAIKVDVASGVSGFVQPGDYVDIYWTGAAGNNGENVTRLIENGIKVIAVDQNADDGLASKIRPSSWRPSLTKSARSRPAKALRSSKPRFPAPTKAGVRPRAAPYLVGPPFSFANGRGLLQVIHIRNSQ